MTGRKPRQKSYEVILIDIRKDILKELQDIKSIMTRINAAMWCYLEQQFPEFRYHEEKQKETP